MECLPPQTHIYFFSFLLPRKYAIMCDFHSLGVQHHIYTGGEPRSPDSESKWVIRTQAISALLMGEAGVSQPCTPAHILIVPLWWESLHLLWTECSLIRNMEKGTSVNSYWARGYLHFPLCLSSFVLQTLDCDILFHMSRMSSLYLTLRIW